MIYKILILIMKNIVLVHVQLGSSAHIALSEPMISKDQQGSSLGFGLTFPSHNYLSHCSHFKFISGQRSEFFLFI